MRTYKHMHKTNIQIRTSTNRLNQLKKEKMGGKVRYMHHLESAWELETHNDNTTRWSSANGNHDSSKTSKAIEMNRRTTWAPKKKIAFTCHHPYTKMKNTSIMTQPGLEHQMPKEMLRLMLNILLTQFQIKMSIIYREKSKTRGWDQVKWPKVGPEMGGDHDLVGVSGQIFWINILMFSPIGMERIND